MLPGLIRSRLVSVLALVVVVASALLPPQGLGIQMCAFKEVTHLPCMGCGLTRSFIALAHGDLKTTALMHPFGFLMFPLAVALLALLFVPTERRERMARTIEARMGAGDWLTTAFIVMFLAYGIGRLIWVLTMNSPRIW